MGKPSYGWHLQYLLAFTNPGLHYLLPYVCLKLRFCQQTRPSVQWWVLLPIPGLLSNLQCSIHCSIKSSAYCNFISAIRKNTICDCIEFPLRGMGFSLVSVSGGCSSLQCVGFSWRWLLLWSMDSESTGSVFVAHGLSCSVSCRILPDQGSNLCLLHWQSDSLPLSHQGSLRTHFFFFKHQKYFVLVYSWLTMSW